MKRCLSPAAVIGFALLVTLPLQPGCNLQKLKLELLNRSSGPAAEGTVSCEGKGLPGVRVSDGYRVVSTDPKGNFRLNLEAGSGPFIFVITPKEYWVDQFWIPIQEAVQGPIQFNLQAKQDSDKEEDFSFIFLTDFHLGESGDKERFERSFQRFAATLEEIGQLSPRPAFLWCGGDISLEQGWGPKFRRMIETLKIPVRHCMGGNDFLADRPDPREEYNFFYGPSYYSFDWGRIHFVSMDGCKAGEGPDGRKVVHAEMSHRELFWLEEDLRSVPEGTLSIVAVHIPILSTYPQRKGTITESAPSWVFQNSDEILQVLERYNVSLILQGHLHENERIHKNRMEFSSTVSVCGRNWQSAGREVGNSNEPRGYRRIEVSGLRIWNNYVSSAESAVRGIGEVVGSPDRLPRGEKVPIYLNLYDASIESEVSVRVDSVRWDPVKPANPENPLDKGLMTHHWLLHADTRQWQPGAHQLQFRVREAEVGKPNFSFIEHRVQVE